MKRIKDWVRNNSLAIVILIIAFLANSAFLGNNDNRAEIEKLKDRPPVVREIETPVVTPIIVPNTTGTVSTQSPPNSEPQVVEIVVSSEDEPKATNTTQGGGSQSGNTGSPTTSPPTTQPDRTIVDQVIDRLPLP